MAALKASRRGGKGRDKPAGPPLGARLGAVLRSRPVQLLGSGLFALSVVAFILYLGVAGWLLATATDTVESRRLAADRAALSETFIIPPPEARPRINADRQPTAAPEPPPTDPAPPVPEIAELVPPPLPAPATPEASEPATPEASEPATPEAPELPLPEAPEPVAEPAPAPDAQPEPDAVAEPAPAAPAPTPPVAVDRPAFEPRQIALPPAPLDGLAERTRAGFLPVIGPDGTPPWQAYARPFDQADPRPRITIVITDMGQSNNATTAAIERLPGEITLAFVPYITDLAQQIARARQFGHEALVMMPMEPRGFPESDPGPSTLLVGNTPPENIGRLERVLGRAPGAIGIMPLAGDRFLGAAESLAPVLASLGTRGLFYLESGAAERPAAPGLARGGDLAFAVADRVLDDIASRDTIDLRLSELERIARERGQAIGLAFPYPVTFQRIAEWLPTLRDKGLVLAPLTATRAAPPPDRDANSGGGGTANAG